MERVPVRKKLESANREPLEAAPEFVSTANVLADLHEISERHKDGSMHADEKILGRLHNDVEHCECYPLFKRYTSGEIPTVDRMFDNLKPYLEELSRNIEIESALVAQGENDEYLKEMKTLHGLLSGRESQIRGSIHRYVASVIRFRNINRRLAGGGRDLLKQFEEADHARRRAHNSLIESLRVYTAQIRMARENGHGDYESFQFEKWSLQDDARRFGPDKTLIFTDEVLANRDFIRDWAIVADFTELLKSLGDDEYIKNNGTADQS